MGSFMCPSSHIRKRNLSSMFLPRVIVSGSDTRAPTCRTNLKHPPGFPPSSWQNGAAMQRGRPVAEARRKDTLLRDLADGVFQDHRQPSQKEQDPTERHLFNSPLTVDNQYHQTTHSTTVHCPIRQVSLKDREERLLPELRYTVHR